jgi:DNA-binding MarR family transcriptional regulator
MRSKISGRTIKGTLAMGCARGLLATLPRLRRLLVEFFPSGKGEQTLTPPQYFTLGCLYAEDCLPSHLSHRLKVSMPTVTSVVDGLVTRGLVKRSSEPDDRRRVKLHLTSAGRHLYQKHRKAVEQRLAHALSQLTVEQQQRLLLALTDLERVLETPYLEEEPSA